MEEQLVSCYTTFPDKDEAKFIIKTLLDQKLIACANITEGESIYTWENKMVTDKEVFCFLKTKASLVLELEKQLLALHSYEVPCFAVLDVIHSAEAYENWAIDVTK